LASLSSLSPSSSTLLLVLVVLLGCQSKEFDQSKPRRYRPWHADGVPMDPRYHTGIPIWERGLTYPHIEMVNHRFHMGIEKFMIPVSIWGSPYGNGDLRLSITIWGLSVTIRGFDTNGSPFPYGDPNMGTGIDYPHMEMVITVSIWGLRSS
jgi:hypothetical protein